MPLTSLPQLVFEITHGDSKQLQARCLNAEIMVYALDWEELNANITNAIHTHFPSVETLDANSIQLLYYPE